MAHKIIGIYKADVYCIDCTKRISAGIQAAGFAVVRNGGTTGKLSDVELLDSDNFPQTCMNGEADSPQHCASCNEFLENPLTTDGYNWLRNECATKPDSITVQMWAEYYELKTWKCSNKHIFRSNVNVHHQFCPFCKQTVYCEKF
jgi:hypothetical protein